MTRTHSPPDGSFSSATSVTGYRRRNRPLLDLNPDDVTNPEEKKRIRNTLAARKSRQRKQRLQEDAEEEIATLKHELDHTRTELDLTTTELSHTKTELYRTRADLNYTATELDCMKAKLDDTKAELNHAKADLDRYRNQEGHRGEPCRPPASPAVPSFYYCTRCHINFTTRNELSRHNAVVHAENHACTDCDYRADRKDRLEWHGLRKHGFKSIVNTGGVYQEAPISIRNGERPSLEPARPSWIPVITLE